jgi:hypothetical protein
LLILKQHLFLMIMWEHLNNQVFQQIKNKYFK